MTPAAVSIEQARLAHKLGIKLRKSDGNYGFKLPCPVCAKPCKDDCFCAATIDAAIHAVKTRKAPWACSRNCALAWDDHWDEVEPQLEDFYGTADETSTAYEEIRDALIKRCRLKFDPEMQIWRGWKHGWVSRIRKADPELYERMQVFFAEEDAADYEPWEDGEGEIENCSCEI